MLCFSAPRPGVGADGEPWQIALRHDLNVMADQLSASLKPWPVPARVFQVENYGAVPATNQKRRVRAIVGASWETPDGGDIENILLTNAHIVRADAPL